MKLASLLEQLDIQQFDQLAEQLKTALNEHQNWMQQINYALLSGCTIDHKAFNASDAHLHCKFGQWLESLLRRPEFQQPDVLSLYQTHRKMHQQSSLLFEKLLQQQHVDLELYQDFQQHHLKLHRIVIDLIEFINLNRSQFDQITHLMNRRSIDTVLNHESQRVFNASRCCLALADLDDFKQINDQYGHDAGDAVLAYVARCFASNIRQKDSVARYGGEEFLFVLPDININQSADIIERVRQKLSSAPIQYNHFEIPVTASFGITNMEADQTIEQSIKFADIALYEAKDAGKNCCRISTRDNVLSPSGETAG